MMVQVAVRRGRPGEARLDRRRDLTGERHLEREYLLDVIAKIGTFRFVSFGIGRMLRYGTIVRSSTLRPSERSFASGLSYADIW